MRSFRDAVSLLRHLRIDRVTQRRLIAAAEPRREAAPRDDELERRLATLIWRGAYVLVRHPPPMRIPAVEEPAEIDGTEHDVEEAPVSDHEDPHPTAIVPREYPRLASVITQATWDAVGKANQDLMKLLHAAPVSLPGDELPQVHKIVATTTTSGVLQAANDAVAQLERQLHSGEPSEPQDQVPDVFRHVANGKKGSVRDVAVAAGDSLARLRFADTELATLDGGIHAHEVPTSYRTITASKIEGIKSSTATTASSLERLLWRGESIEVEDPAG